MFAERLKTLRKANNLQQKDIAKKLFVDSSTISQWERGHAKPDYQKQQMLADLFNVSLDYLTGRSDEQNPKSTKSETSVFKYDNIFPIETKKFPLLGEIACGEPIFTNEDRESYVEAGADIRADFCLRAKGDSMINARIMDGDIAFIRQQPIVVDGEIAAVVIDDVATLKRVYYDKEQQQLTLVAENTKYPPLVYRDEQLDHIHILGKAVAFQSDVV
ncbi:MAG: helix-turn-helix domain-containing protein [Oscillospiraceae bacterium]|nr:helix-turn-helix domain-containing protein [Oscillospiraceae bacterium]